MIEGIVNVLKPPGLTSSDVVGDIRRIFDEKRVGHTGTLDPGAAGVLPVCLGRATRLFDYLVDKQKEYIAEIRFGAATDTQDAYGAVIAQSDREVNEAELLAVLPEFMGEITQVVPMYSAVRQNGKQLYKLAREGVETVQKTREVTIDELELITNTGRNRYLLRIVCSKGTYVRTICHDIGERLNAMAYLSFLLRTRTGMFLLDETYSIKQLNELKTQGILQNAVIPVEHTLAHLGEARLIGLSVRQEKLLRNGAPIEHADLIELPENCPLRTYIDDEFIGIGIINSGKLHIQTFFSEGERHGR